jgi:hypothetical protein
MTEKMVSIRLFCGERFAQIAETLEKMLNEAGVEFVEERGERFYPEKIIDQALGALVRTNLTLAQGAERN